MPPGPYYDPSQLSETIEDKEEVIQTTEVEKKILSTPLTPFFPFLFVFVAKVQGGRVGKREGLHSIVC